MITKKIKELCKNIFKTRFDVITFCITLAVMITLLIPVPYYIKIGGGTIRIDEKVIIENSNKSTGSLEALYVKEGEGVVLTYLLSFVIPSFDREKIDNVTTLDEDMDSYNYREKLYFTTSLDAATKVALEKAGKKVYIDKTTLSVLYIDKTAKTNLKLGDVILKIGEVFIKDFSDMENIIRNKKVGDKVTILVNRNGKKIKTTSTLIEMDKAPKLGIIISNQVSYKSDPEVNFKFSGNEAGPSGGLMIALSIYNKVADQDITKGRRIMGTGAIDTEGNVGEIGGIKYKLMAASRKKADIVLVPYLNYDEAYKEKIKHKYKFKLIKVKTFDDAINALQK